MTYLFTGILTGGILGAAIGTLGTAVYFLKKEACRLKNRCGREKGNA